MDEITEPLEAKQGQNEAPEETTFEGRATYSPEDNKLRLYIGRVPREEYLKLRAEGWKALHKQREAGGGDFVATWTPERRDTALEYAGIIEDEDMGPAERAADRAERFAGYREKRTAEATGQADRYDAGPSAHGYQSAARAERSVRCHDRIAGRAVDAWDKAEYWQQRTAGVISHALYVSSPSVRMGRIKELEKQLRNYATPGGDWHKHLTLRLAYENQMLEAQGGRAAHVEMIAGGWLGSRQIHKVNKSPVTGRVVSVLVKGPRINGWVYQAQNVAGTDYALYHVETERLPADAYRAPTAEELATFEAERKAEKKALKAKAPPTIPLINPTDEDAERLQAIWNERNAKDIAYRNESAPTVLRITQAQYSANSGGNYAAFEAVEITGGGFKKSNRGRRDQPDCPVVAKVRAHRRRVIVITDKPQKAFAANVWEDPRPEIVSDLESNFYELEQALKGAEGRKGWLPEDGTPEGEIIRRAQIVGLVYVSSMTQFGFTEKGHEWAKEQRELAAL